MKVAKLFITNLKCQGCIETISKVLNKQKAILNYVFTLSEKSVEIEFDANKISIEKVQTIISKIGYQTEVK